MASAPTERKTGTASAQNFTFSPSSNCGTGTLVLIVCLPTANTFVVTSVTDTKGNTWTVDKTVADNGRLTVSICSTKQNVGSLTTSDVITVNRSGSNTCYYWLEEFPGKYDPDVSASNSGTTGAGSTGTTSPTASSDEFSVSSVCASKSGGTAYWTWSKDSNDSWFTTGQQPSSATKVGYGTASAYRLNPTQGQGVQSTFTVDQTTNYWNAAIVAYKAVSVQNQSINAVPATTSAVVLAPTISVSIASVPVVVGIIAPISATLSIETGVVPAITSAVVIPPVVSIGGSQSINAVPAVVGSVSVQVPNQVSYGLYPPVAISAASVPVLAYSISQSINAVPVVVSVSVFSPTYTISPSLTAVPATTNVSILQPEYSIITGYTFTPPSSTVDSVAVQIPDKVSFGIYLPQVIVITDVLQPSYDIQAGQQDQDIAVLRPATATAELSQLVLDWEFIPNPVTVTSSLPQHSYSININSVPAVVGSVSAQVPNQVSYEVNRILLVLSASVLPPTYSISSGYDFHPPSAVVGSVSAQVPNQVSYEVDLIPLNVSSSVLPPTYSIVSGYDFHPPSAVVGSVSAQVPNKVSYEVDFIPLAVSASVLPPTYSIASGYDLHPPSAVISASVPVHTYSISKSINAVSVVISASVPVHTYSISKSINAVSVVVSASVLTPTRNISQNVNAVPVGISIAISSPSRSISQSINAVPAVSNSTVNAPTITRSIAINAIPATISARILIPNISGLKFPSTRPGPDYLTLDPGKVNELSLDENHDALLTLTARTTSPGLTERTTSPGLTTRTTYLTLNVNHTTGVTLNENHTSHLTLDDRETSPGLNAPDKELILNG